MPCSRGLYESLLMITLITVELIQTKFYIQNCIYRIYTECWGPLTPYHTFPKIHITKTCLYNFDPLKPHFYLVKLGFTGVYIIFLISAQKTEIVSTR